MLQRAGSHVRKNLIAYTALFFALGGTSFAAAAALVPNNSVGSPQIINHSIRTIDISGRTVRALHGARGPRGLRGLTGATGPKGDKGDKGDTGATGAPGSAIAYAKVNSNGTVDATQSKNITSANVTLRATSAYCFHDLSFAPKNVVATIAYGSLHNGSAGSEIAQAEIDAMQATDCAPGEKVEVATADTNPFDFAPHAFYVVFN